jgi:hypothetical protein
VLWTGSWIKKRAGIDFDDAQAARLQPECGAARLKFVELPRGKVIRNVLDGRNETLKNGMNTLSFQGLWGRLSIESF